MLPINKHLAKVRLLNQPKTLKLPQLLKKEMLIVILYCEDEVNWMFLKLIKHSARLL